ncbi:6-phosphogluconolactonase [Myxococcus fulvus]|uniref:6-phosphogluconolactonase n=1 Tax=Myxococcus fulvus TaxID=33 RepID=A0A511SUD2_MYXFU|nr:6-phosphogluconolactonase [Myxococcus fulvus]AKF79690.1 6-phosphogluconolactonase [Myxococcus fulvus 124B02]GEN05531.1 6-phosphogluconolactonase [Myxococcus fulvus]SET04152.1 6-phosphogluconolactonase [Myxococcus fulvus]
MSALPPRVVPPESLAREAAEWMGRALQTSLAMKRRASLALSGGSTPAPAYRELSRLTLPWERVDLYFVDERFVPPDHPDSNYHLVEEALVGPLRLSPSQVFRMEGEREDREAAAEDYEARLPDVLDVVLLGMGEDGHTASLFPGHPALEEQSRRVLSVVGPKPPPWRMTLTMPTLLSANAVLMLVAGAGKRQTVQRALGRDAALPAARVTNAQWMMDTAAAGR